MSDITQPLSYRAQIEALDEGETFARARRFDGNDCDAITKDALAEALRNLRLAMQPTVYRIRQRTGFQYTIESGEFRTEATRDIMIVLTVTRTA